MKVLLSSLLISMLCYLPISAQTNTASQLPKVFILGQDEATYNELTKSYSQSLLETSNNDIELAFTKWMEMMKEVDTYAEKINFNIKGIRLFMHVFWNESGSIDHIGYLLRPDSRNVDTAELNAFFSSFMNRYTFPLNSPKKFSHYTGATFPTFSEKTSGK